MVAIGNQMDADRIRSPDGKPDSPHPLFLDEMRSQYPMEFIMAPLRKEIKIQLSNGGPKSVRVVGDQSARVVDVILLRGNRFLQEIAEEPFRGDFFRFHHLSSNNQIDPLSAGTPEPNLLSM
jgi:hypothetical protein